MLSSKMVRLSTLSLLSVFLLLAMLLVVSCADPEEEAAEVAAIDQPTAEPTQEVAPTVAEPTAEPAATEHSHEETTAPPTEEAAAAAPAAPAADRLGLLRFSDNEQVRAGDFNLQLLGVAAPAAGTHYELWVQDDAGNALNLGTVPVAAEIAYTGSTAEDLLGKYSSGFLSIEQDGVNDGEIGPVAYSGTVPPGSLLHIRHIVYQFADNPGGQGFLIGAENQLILAIEHANLLREALAAGDLAEAQQHAEHVVNIIDGKDGEFFGDLDGDGVPQNPGDGFGVRAYFEGAKEHAQLAAEAEGATFEVNLHAGHVIISSDNVLGWLEEAIDLAIRVISSDSAAEAQPASQELDRMLAQDLNGVDANGDGAIAPVEGEGGWQTAYEHAQFMGAFEFFAADGAPAAAVPVAPAPAEATAAPPAAGANEVIIEMVDFEYSQKELTIPVGTIVTWVNNGTKRHSATADDGSFNTGLFDPGQSVSITFNTPGEFQYFCELHGGPGGQGMSAKIIVTADGAAAPPLAEEVAPPAGNEVVVDITDFAFSQPQLTIPVGTTVTWVNKGAARHSATADDGSFNTGLFEPGQQASVTFNTPGTFQYFCELHGGPGGQGMSAVVIVE